MTLHVCNFFVIFTLLCKSSPYDPTSGFFFVSMTTDLLNRNLSYFFYDFLKAETDGRVIATRSQSESITKKNHESQFGFSGLVIQLVVKSLFYFMSKY